MIISLSDIFCSIKRMVNHEVDDHGPFSYDRWMILSAIIGWGRCVWSKRSCGEEEFWV